MASLCRLLPILFFASFASAEPATTLTVRGAGTGIDMAAAEKAAVADALLQAANAVLDDVTFSKQKPNIIEKVLPKAADAVKSHEVLKTEKLADGKFQVRVRATVDRASLIAKLVEAKVPVPGVADKDDPSSELREKVVKFCKDKLGQQVGDGECGTLAQEAIKEAGGKAVNLFTESPGPGDYVWGELVFTLEMKDGKRKREPTTAVAKPGDVIQYRDVVLRSSRGIYLMVHHTAIVAEVKSSGEMLVFEQNMQGKKEVTKGTLRPTELAGGWVRVYRPVAK
jgi:hypothetical protein